MRIVCGTIEGSEIKFQLLRFRVQYTSHGVLQGFEKILQGWHATFGLESLVSTLHVCGIEIFCHGSSSRTTYSAGRASSQAHLVTKLRPISIKILQRAPINANYISIRFSDLR